MSKHTPGPWTITEKNANGTRSPWGYVEVADLRFITVEGRTRDEAKANARLIAAAPDLLAAGKLCPDRADFGTASDYADAVDVWWRNEMLHAIAKAEGLS